MILSWQQMGIDTRGKTTGSVKTFCPHCHKDRKHQRDMSCNVNMDGGVYHCHNCGKSGTRYVSENKNYNRPKQNLTNLSSGTIEWFKRRGIEENVLQYFKITESTEWMPEGEEDDKVVPAGKYRTINFNYFRDGELINIKYRDRKKSFRMVKDAELIFYNLDAIKGKKECLICEGEIDCMSFYSCGYFYALSVPNGASKSNAARLTYLDNCWQHFEDKEKIYIATDQDEAGLYLRSELIRRLGADRCFVVTFGDCKDANEYLVLHGAERLLECVKMSEPVPVSGIWRANDFKDKIYNLYYHGREKPFKVHLGDFDELLAFRKGDFTIVTGIPNHGKSYWTLWLTVLLSSFYGWKWVLFCPENMPEEELVSLIASMFIGESFDTENAHFKMSKENVDLAVQFINEHYYFFKYDETDIDVDTIGEKFKECVKKYGVCGGVIDPWNKVEHMIPEGQNETQYINKTLSKFTSICKTYGMHIFFVAHPTKLKKDKDTGQYEVPNLYSISGSAHFHNQPDNGMVVYRNSDNTVDVLVEKVRWKFIGKPGECKFKFDYYTGRYAELTREHLLPYRYWLELKNDGVVNTFELDLKPLNQTATAEIKEEEYPF